MKNNASLTIVLSAAQIQLPLALKLLLKRAAVSDSSFENVEQLLFYLFGLPYEGELPVAAVTGLIDDLDTRTHYWLRADPVELRADLAAVYLLGNQHLADKENFSPVLVNQLQKLLVSDDLVLYTPHAQRWYLQLARDPELKTQPLDSSIGRNIYNILPAGAKKNYWRKLFTEIQMLLHQPSSSEGTANALWFWGAGKLPAVHAVKWRTIWSNQILTQGLARLMGINAQEFLDGKACLQQLQPGNNLITLIHPVMDENFFKALIKALRYGKIKELAIYLGDKHYLITSRSIWYVWRRKKL